MEGPDFPMVRLDLGNQTTSSIFMDVDDDFRGPLKRTETSTSGHSVHTSLHVNCAKLPMVYACGAEFKRRYQNGPEGI